MGGRGLDGNGGRSRDSLRKTAMGTDRDRAGTRAHTHGQWTPSTQMPRAPGVKGVQGQGLSYMTQHLVLCVWGSLNRSLCLGRYFSR